MEQIMQTDPAITKKILKLSDVQINQKLELNRPGKIFPDKKDSEMSKSSFDFMDSIVIGDNVMLVTVTSMLVKNHQHNEKSRQHNDSVTNILNRSSS